VDSSWKNINVENVEKNAVQAETDANKRVV